MRVVITFAGDGDAGVTRLKVLGFELVKIHYKLGIITGVLPADKMDEARKVEGVKFIREEKPIKGVK